MHHRWVIVLSCLLVIVSIVPLFMFVGKNFLPVDDQSQFKITVRAPEGSSLAATSPRWANRRPTCESSRCHSTLITIGGGQQEQVNVASIYVKLLPINERANLPATVDVQSARTKYFQITSSNTEAVSCARASKQSQPSLRRFPQR